jgi:phosphate starvation-inducible PhoH-like protein
MKKSKASFVPMHSPRTTSQHTYVKYLDDATNKIIIPIGPAGTGKTMFACQKAITQLKSEEIDKIIITRPAVTVEEEIGFLPGNIVKKMDPWTKPIFDIFLEYFNRAELDLMLYNNKIEICPLAFMRGRTFKNAFIIADEMQNSSPNQMKMLVTRLGDNSRMVITGDLQQSDIKGENGLNDFVYKFEKYQSNKKNIETFDAQILNVTVNENATIGLNVTRTFHYKPDLIKLVYFENKDIERSDVVKQVIEIYDYKDDKKYEYKEVVKQKNTSKKATPASKEKIVKEGDAALIPFHHYYKI